jgi:hypothetical protein
MPEESSAVSKISPAPGDYDSICAALMQTERGRWFLQEYARRNRSTDTKVLLDSIARIEAVVCAERHKQVHQDFRSELLEMSEAITRTREEVADIRSDAAAPHESALPDGEASPMPRSPPPGGVFAAAGRIRDVTWAMRGHGFDPTTCDQLEELAASILSASALRDPTDHRARKLSEVLQYLEHRIDTLLDSCADGDAPAGEPDRQAHPSVPALGAAHRNGSASAFLNGQHERNGADSQAGLEPPASPQIRLSSAPPAASPPAAEIAPPRRPPDAGGESAAKATILVRNQQGGAQTAGETSAPVQRPLAGTTPASMIADHAFPAPLASPADAASVRSAPPVDGAAARARSPDAFLPALELAGNPRSLQSLQSPAAQAASAALREEAARQFLPEIHMRAKTAESLPVPQPADGDPLAALKAMSDNELIALFS